MIKLFKSWCGWLGVFGLAISSSKSSSSNQTSNRTENIDQRTTTQTGNAVSVSGSSSLVMTDSGAINGMQQIAHDAITAVATSKQDELHQAFGLAQNAIQDVTATAGAAQNATAQAVQSALDHIQNAYSGATQPDKTLMLAGFVVLGAVAIFARRS